MSWVTASKDGHGNAINCFTDCKHGDTCHIPKIAGDIGAIMSSVDVGTDGHMAIGTAELHCNGFERVEASETESASEEKAQASGPADEKPPGDGGGA